MNIIGVIPARMQASRFPGKPLAKICGLSMIEHVYRRCRMSDTLKELYVATCDQQIVEVVRSFGGQAVMTADTHQRASDRVAEAVRIIEKSQGRKVEIVVMIQGDEPMVYPEMIDQAVGPLISENQVMVVNLASEIQTDSEFEDSNCIKVVFDKAYNALYFSRKAIPSKRERLDELKRFKQVCIIPFRRDFLFEYSRLSPTLLERAESIDMLRILEHGMKVHMVPRNPSNV